MKLAPIDILIILAYVGVILYIAARSRKFAGKNLENYFLAGRSMPGWLTGVSYAASMVSADSAVGYGGLAVVTGLYVSWIYMSRFGIALFLGAMLFARLRGLARLAAALAVVDHQVVAGLGQRDGLGAADAG